MNEPNVLYAVGQLLSFYAVKKNAAVTTVCVLTSVFILVMSAEVRVCLNFT